jgi:O-methyltransferase/methyltransferase family protein
MTEIDPNVRLWNLLRGALGTKALGIAADLGVADLLAGGPRPVAELAEESGAHPDTLYRMLRALASDGIFAEDELGVFRNTDASELLGRAQPGAWLEFAHLFGAVFYDAVATMDARAEGETFTGAFGTDFWSWLAQNPVERAIFDAAMAGEKDGTVARVGDLEWRGDETVVDVGGGNGALLRELLDRRPSLSGIVFDLPETKRDEASLGERIMFVEGSFFERVPAGDAYVLSRILHDWDDERATAILRTVRTAALPDARLFVLDAVIPPGNQPMGSKWLDLLMLVLAGGRERTKENWHALLESAGFRIDQIEDGLIQARCR